MVSWVGVGKPLKALQPFGEMDALLPKHAKSYLLSHQWTGRSLPTLILSYLTLERADNHKERKEHKEAEWFSDLRLNTNLVQAVDGVTLFL